MVNSKQGPFDVLSIHTDSDSNIYRFIVDYKEGIMTDTTLTDRRIVFFIKHVFL